MRLRKLVPAAFLLPSLIGFAAFIFLPILMAIGLSLFRWDIFHPPRFVGLANFRELLGRSSAPEGSGWNDPAFWKYLGNTLFFLLAIPFSMALSLLLALLLNRPFAGRTFFRTVLFLPTVCMGVGLILMWRYMYDPDFGMINGGLRELGIRGPDWLHSYAWAKPAIMNMGIWAAMGGTNMIIYLAGLQGIPPELYEAAVVDGAGRWARFRHITVPMLAPSTLFILITSVIAAFQGEFESAYLMTQGGPNGATTTLSYYIFNHAFQWFNMGYAAAISLVLFALTLLATAANWWLAGGRAKNV